MKSIEHPSSKNQIIDKIKLIKTFKATWEYDSETKEYWLLVTGLIKGEFMGKTGLTEADKQWIANLVITVVKPIKEDIAEIKERLKAIEECPTIKRELLENKKNKI